MRPIPLALISIALVTLPAGAALGHSGGTDRCGGHLDHKRGGYHVHDYSKYCACEPEYAFCARLKKGPEQGAQGRDEGPKENGKPTSDRKGDEKGKN